MRRPERTMERTGIVLAAGEGRRLQPFIRQWRGDTLPKQYVDFTGDGSLLERTWRRAEQLLPAERLLTIVNRSHLTYREACRQLANRDTPNVIIQPENKETGVGLYLSLLHLHRLNPDAVMVVFPSDHFIDEETLFMGHVELACREVERNPAGFVLLGIEPTGPEPEYGYLLPGRRKEDGVGGCMKRLIQFEEKPDRETAGALIQAGALWNAFVMVARVERFVTLMRWLAPALCRAFEHVERAIGTSRERETVESVYRHLEPVNFSSNILQAAAAHRLVKLSVLPVRGVGWSDWGSAERLMAHLRRLGHLTWLKPLGAGQSLPSIAG
ncbi:MAG TPA: sugar phosphate nucleotidyltransferase [Nitrospiria bacterium]|nr:sugar phosphate nucleotidyltransferase [Nitrospiria bacterium]